MSESDESSDGRSSSAPRRAVLTYSRKALLALYDSPLVPARLPGMKDLAVWYGFVTVPLRAHELGVHLTPPLPSPTRSSRSCPRLSSEFSDHPSSPQQNHRQQHHALHSELSRAANPAAASTNPPSSSTAAALRAAANARPNPFANFGRFGLDGGLEGDSVALTPGAKRSTGRDAAPHIAIPGAVAIGGSGARRAPSPERAKYGASPTNGAAGAYFSNERERSDRMRARGDGPAPARGEPGATGRERRDREDAQKREGRAEEGGWRSVGTSGASSVMWSPPGSHGRKR